MLWDSYLECMHQDAIGNVSVVDFFARVFFQTVLFGVGFRERVSCRQYFDAQILLM